jgi:isocitrate dehydrogenase (NAD+)
MLSGVLMLRHLGEQAAAERVEGAIRTVIAEGRRTTSDLGGDAGTSQFADAVIEELGGSDASAPSGDGMAAGSSRSSGSGSGA